MCRKPDIQPGLNVEEIALEVWRVKSLIDTCVCLFPESAQEFDHENELFAVLGTVQILTSNLEQRLQAASEISVVKPSNLLENIKDL